MLLATHGEAPDAEDTREQEQQGEQDHRQCVVGDDGEHVLQSQRRSGEVLSRHPHVP